MKFTGASKDSDSTEGGGGSRCLSRDCAESLWSLPRSLVSPFWCWWWATDHRLEHLSRFHNHLWGISPWLESAVRTFAPIDGWRRWRENPTSLFHHHFCRPLFKNGVRLDELWSSPTAPASLPGTSTPLSITAASPRLAVNLQPDGINQHVWKLISLWLIFVYSHWLTHSSLAFLLIIFGAKVFCKNKNKLYKSWIATSSNINIITIESGERFVPS